MRRFFPKNHRSENDDPKLSRTGAPAGLRLLAVLLTMCLLAASAAGCRPRSSASAGTDLKGTAAAESGSEAAAAKDAGTGSGDHGSGAGTDSSEADGGADSGALLTLPYDDPDPAQKAAAYPWICSDLINNAKNLAGFPETEDFHAAVNREWLSSNSIPDGYISYDTFAERQLEVDEELQEILVSEKVFDDPYIAHCQKLVQDYYKMWLDWDARDAAGVEPLREVIAPLEKVQSLEEMTAYLSDPKTTIEALPLCASFTAANPNDADSIAVYISVPSLVFSDPKYYAVLDSDSWKTQPRYMYAAGYMLERLGYTERERDRILKDSYAFECEMAGFMMTTEEKNAEDASIRCNNPRTLQQLEAEQGNFPLTGMLKGAGVQHSNVFILQEPEWLEGMRGLYDEAHLEQMKAYLLVSDVLQFMELLDHDCYNRMIQVRNILSGSSGQVEDRKAACDAVNSVLEAELGEVYAQTYVTEKTRTDVTEMVHDVIDYYHTMLEGEDFLSDATRAEAIKKLENLTIRVASPEDFEEEEAALEAAAEAEAAEDTAAKSEAAEDTAAEAETASGSDTSSAAEPADRILDFRGPEEGGSLVEARIAISEDTCLSIAEEVNQSVDRSEWIASPQDVNAYYYPLDNSINIPSGILGGVFYNDRMSREEKLGHVGVVIAHEVSHAFDTSGRQYDERGNLRNWWTEDDYRRFHARAQKLVDYYDGFEPIEGYPVNGAMIDTEAIADLTGVKCMLRIAADEEDFDYDLFFRTLASNWRCLTTLETEAYCIEQDSHPLPYLRTNAVVVQFEEFHRTYGTKEGDGMYLAPEFRLEVW